MYDGTFTTHTVQLTGSQGDTKTLLALGQSHRFHQCLQSLVRAQQASPQLQLLSLLQPLQRLLELLMRMPSPPQPAPLQEHQRSSERYLQQITEPAPLIRTEKTAPPICRLQRRVDEKQNKTKRGEENEKTHWPEDGNDCGNATKCRFLFQEPGERERALREKKAFFLLKNSDGKSTALRRSPPDIRAEPPGRTTPRSLAPDTANTIPRAPSCTSESESNHPHVREHARLLLHPRARSPRERSRRSAARDNGGSNVYGGGPEVEGSGQARAAGAAWGWEREKASRVGAPRKRVWRRLPRAPVPEVAEDGDRQGGFS